MTSTADAHSIDQSESPGSDHTDRRGPRVPALFRPLLTRRGWLDLGYALVALPVGIAGFVFTVVTVTVSGGLSFTLIGIPALAATGLASRYLASWWRTVANSVMGWRIPAPRPILFSPGFRGWLVACLKDGAVWRSRLYLVLKLPLGIASFIAATVLYSIAFGGVSYWVWYRWLPCSTSSPDGTCHRGATLWDGTYLDTPSRLVLLAVVGLVALTIAPWVVRAVLQVDRWAMRALLGPSRIAELQRTRAQAVDDSAATLRRIERDLHDGAQARLVSLAMNIGLAKEKLAEGDDPASAATLLDSAHDTAKAAIAEVRDLARGIHPPALESGLDTALQTLVAHSVVPARLATTIARPPAPSIASIAYFCAAELITNATKHSGASEITVDVRTVGERLRLRIGDDGVGGAEAVAGGGLAGLADRVRTVDGSLTIDSPAGGPTAVTVELPLRADQSGPGWAP